AAATPPRPFSSYLNPFRDGTAAGQPPAELVRYSFAALEAWAWESDLGRRPEETPLEFTARVGDELPALEDATGRLAALYVRVTYARATLPANSLGVVQQFWRQLEAAAERTTVASR